MQRQDGAKAYLKARSEELRALDAGIDRKRERLARLRARLVSGTTVLTGMPGGGSGGRNRSFDSMVRLIALGEEINADVERLAEAQSRLTAEIRRCKDADVCAVLELRYVDRLSWAAIAERMHYTEDGIFKLHGRALRMFGRVNGKSGS